MVIGVVLEYTFPDGGGVPIVAFSSFIRSVLTSLMYLFSSCTAAAAFSDPGYVF